MNCVVPYTNLGTVVSRMQQKRNQPMFKVHTHTHTRAQTQMKKDFLTKERKV